MLAFARRGSEARTNKWQGKLLSGAGAGKRSLSRFIAVCGEQLADENGQEPDSVMAENNRLNALPDVLEQFRASRMPPVKLPPGRSYVGNRIE